MVAMVYLETQLQELPTQEQGAAAEVPMLRAAVQAALEL
jgi:hypothetical protein